MSAESIVAISAAVTAFVQLIKWGGLRDHWGPVVVIALSGVGVGVWLFSQPDWPPARTDTWDIFAGWINVALSSAGIFGFTRAAVGAVTRATPPPAGTAEQPVETAAGIDYERLASEMERQRRERVMANLEARANDGIRRAAAGREGLNE
jgi:hypothetical protein